jgi:serine/threonine protein kinase
MKTALSKWIPKRQLVGAVQIDSGSFGRIYRSKYDDLQVAVKEIAQASSSLRSKIKEISYELDALVKCDHPNVVHFHGAALEFAPGGQPSIALVFELCERGSVHRNIFEKRTLSTRRKVLIGAQVAAGLAYLHKQHILHRDLNTRNVLLDGEFSAKIADFGCAVRLFDKPFDKGCAHLVVGPDLANIRCCT